MDIFVYYRVLAANTTSLLPAVIDMQQSLAQQMSVSASLKRRLEENDGCQTWMEVYAQVPENFLPALNEAAAEAGLMNRIEGMRHTETFVDIVACA